MNVFDGIRAGVIGVRSVLQGSLARPTAQPSDAKYRKACVRSGCRGCRLTQGIIDCIKAFQSFDLTGT